MNQKFNQIGKIILGTTIFMLIFLSFLWKVYIHILGIIIVPILWLLRYRLKNIVDKLGIKGFLGFLFIGWLITGLYEETAYWVSGFRILPDISLFGDILVTTPARIVYLSCWWFLAKRYQYTLEEKFLLGGILGVLLEEGSRVLIGLGHSIASRPLLLFLASIIMFIIYGFIIMFPFWLMQNQIPEAPKRDEKIKYVLAAFLPWLCWLAWVLFLSIPYYMPLLNKLGLLTI